MNPEHEPQTDPHAQARIQERHTALAVGALALPNLLVRSLVTLGLLYGALGIVLIALVQLGYLPSAAAAVGIGCALILLQYLVGPWVMDLSLRWLYKLSWVEPSQLPEHLAAFVEKVCEQNRMKFPSFGIIHDGAPAAFTYGHRPDNARVVISRGLIDLLEPAELEAVVAHELGHARNWDMALMTLAQLVPLLLYYVYDIGLRTRGGGDDKGKGYGVIVAIGAYVLYIISEYLVLWFSRTREYFADRFAGEATGQPNALSTALVKIAYGLAARGDAASSTGDDKEKQAAAARSRRIDAIGAMNIFDRGNAVSLVMSSAATTDTRPNVELIKGAMQWDLWNPWALYYELNSTHPLTAKRLQALGDQAASRGQAPLVTFDRAKPESYWDEFLVDLAVLWAPSLAFLGGLAMFIVQLIVTESSKSAVWLGLGIMLSGLLSLIGLRFSYRGGPFENLTVAALLHRVKVSAVRPIPVTLTGTIIGKGVPGLIWSEDFVVRDNTGLMFLDYRQPLAIWQWLFGLFRAGQYQGKEVRITGWYRRSPVPFVELKHLHVLDGSLPDRRTYSYYAQYAMAGLFAVVGAGILAWFLLNK